MDFHLGFMFVCLLALANVLIVNGDSNSAGDEVKNEEQDLDTQSKTLDGQIRAYLGLRSKKKPDGKPGRKYNKKKKAGRKPGKRPNKKTKSAKKKKKTNASKNNGNKEAGKETSISTDSNMISTVEYNPTKEEKLNNHSKGTDENRNSIEDIKNEIRDKIEEIGNHTHNSLNQTEKRNGTNGTTRNLSHQGFSISGGPSPNEGNVFYNGKPICDDYWDNTDAGVFCRMLGYQDGTATHFSKYGQVSYIFSMDDVRCNGDEVSLLHCSHTTRENCGPSEGAGVHCRGFSISGGNSRNEGNIFYNGKPICDDDWDNTDAGVLCRMMGYQFGTATIRSKYGYVSNDFSMDDVQCNGDEISLLDCRHTTQENCWAAEGAGVYCHGFSIHGGPSRYEGNVFYNGRPVCDDYWDNTDARVFCRSMGYSDGKATKYSKYGKVSSNFILDNVQCNGGESDILQCNHITNHNCGSHEGAGVICSGCHCLNHMSPYGFGNCKKYSPALKGKMCYVDSTSTCTDKLPSQTEKGLYKSAIACCKNKRRRKNVASLTSTEKERLRTALKNAIASTIPWRNYADNGNYHGAPRSTICQNRNGYCCEHDEKFLPWHRLYTVNMEQLLDEALPYWDWTQSGTVPDLFNGILGPIKKPYRSEATECDGTDVTHHRKGEDIQIDPAELKRRTKQALDQTSFVEFNNAIQSIHGIVHRNMKCDMATFETSAYDPLFFLHHTYVDYQFAYWQELQRLRYPDQPELSLSDDIMHPFNDGAYNPYEITRRNSKAKDTVDYENNLGFVYDNLLFDEKTPQEYLDASNTRSGPSNRRVFVGVVMPKMASTSLVEFDVCNIQNKCIKGGSLATFGPIDAIPSSNTVDDIITNYNMIEYEVTDAVDGDASFDTNSTARITSSDDLGILSGLEPIMIWRYDGGVQGGMVYLSHGSIRNSYGKLLSKYAEVKEN